MVTLNENFLVNKVGQKVGVFLKMKTYRKLLEDLEELEDIRAYDEAKASGDTAIPFEKAVHKIERSGRKCVTR
ncbi:MAG: hypothetical protein JW768_02005 [Chitinispirillaceae bacterium]|nr:hypothetical protein [Chitinispirillaceae bacterium]